MRNVLSKHTTVFLTFPFNWHSLYRYLNNIHQLFYLVIQKHQTHLKRWAQTRFLNILGRAAPPLEVTKKHSLGIAVAVTVKQLPTVQHRTGWNQACADLWHVRLLFHATMVQPIKEIWFLMTLWKWRAKLVGERIRTGQISSIFAKPLAVWFIQERGNTWPNIWKPSTETPWLPINYIQQYIFRDICRTVLQKCVLGLWAVSYIWNKIKKWSKLSEKKIIFSHGFAKQTIFKNTFWNKYFLHMEILDFKIIKNWQDIWWTVRCFSQSEKQDHGKVFYIIVVKIY